MGKYKCPFCGNEDPKYFGFFHGQIYCRYCISFHGEPAETSLDTFGNGKVFASYSLTEKQKEVSSAIIENFKNKKNTLVYAVTGAGKTELVFGIISYCLENKLQVGFAIPRKDVVIELYQRLAPVFRNNNVIAVYGGNTQELQGNLIILTTHQLYRYDHYFDLLILDEIDAFPYKSNNLLLSMFKRSCKGNYILLSATPSKDYIDEFVSKGGSLLKLMKRFHGSPLPVPKVIICYGIFKYIYVFIYLRKFLKEKKPVLIFTPTIDESETLFRVLNLFVKNGNFVNSTSLNRNKIISDFKKNKYKFLVTTSVLERGVTIDNLQVIIFNADSKIYDDMALVQISGRVGRKAPHPFGDVIYIAGKRNLAIENSIRTIKECNDAV